VGELKIKILTINTWKAEGDYFTRIKILADQLQELNPDIIVCQECFMVHDSNINTLEFLSQELKMNRLFTPARSKKRKFNNTEVDSDSGLGILSSFPIHSIDDIVLPCFKEDGERKVQVVTVELAPGKEIAILNIHLTHLRDATELRRNQINALAEAVAPLKVYEIILICGDFNVEIDSDEIELLTSLVKARDVYALGEGKRPRTELLNSNHFQIQTVVDHIFALPGSDGNYPLFSDSRIALNYPDKVTGIYASDHPAILTTLHYNIV
jgi:endonuclease/exonuclease/phosphatase family metal-dependent hydrolase